MIKPNHNQHNDSYTINIGHEIIPESSVENILGV